MFRVAALAAAVLAVSCGVGQSDVTTTDDATATTDQEVRKNSPCNTVKCSAGNHCVARGQSASCEVDTCRTDSDCRLSDNYCDGCACNALLAGASDPVCGGTTVSCFAQPCMGKVAKCDRGACVVGTAGATGGGPKCGTKTCATGEYCCNSSCSLCAPMGAMCIQMVCN